MRSTRFTVSTARILWRRADRDRVAQKAASLAYFALFALPGVLVIVVGVTRMILGSGSERLFDEVSEVAGPKASGALRDILSESAPFIPTSTGGVIALVGFLIGATGLFLHLQDALNGIWRTRGLPRRTPLRELLAKRALSLLLLLLTSLVGLASLAISALLSAFGGALTSLLTPDLSAAAVFALHSFLSAALLAGLFAVTYRLLPDCRIEWRVVVRGAVGAAAVFVIGKTAFGLWIAHTNPHSSFGAAGPVVLVLAWLYFSMLVFLLGAELTRTDGERRARCGRKTSVKGRRSRRGPAHPVAAST